MYDLWNKVYGVRLDVRYVSNRTEKSSELNSTMKLFYILGMGIESLRFRFQGLSLRF